MIRLHPFLSSVFDGITIRLMFFFRSFFFFFHFAGANDADLRKGEKHWATVKKTQEKE